jgi:hypothetical protein
MKQEEILQAYLQQIESGAPLRQVLTSLPADQQDLSTLLTIAAKTRSAAHPALSASSAEAQKQRVMASAASVKLGTASAAPQRNANSSVRSFRRIAPFAFACVTMMAVFMVVLFATLAFYINTTNAAHKATLEGVAGIVESAPADDPNNWSVLASGDQVVEGARLRARTDSNATLRFFDGSQAQLGPKSELILDKLNGAYNLLSGKSLQVRIRQTQGETQYQVVPLKGSASFYEVQTPSGMVVVHGTIFNVAVETSGAARFAVSRGSIMVKQLNNQVFLTAGQATVASTNQTLLPPAFEYALQGQISAIDTNHWTVNGVTFTVDPRASSALSYTANDWVSVRGRILADGSYTADHIANAEDEQPSGYFTGSVESMSTTVWVISGKNILVNGSTQISPDIKVNDPVKVTFVNQTDGAWLATAIAKLDSDHEEDNPTATPASSETALTPTGTRTPEIKLTKTHEPEETEKPHGTEEAHKTPLPTSTLSPSATPDGTLTPVASPTPAGTATPEGPRSGCDAADHTNHKGEELAAQWGVSYQEIITWFCQGFGFGEIDLAYELAKESGKPVADIFMMKSNGDGWGKIKQSIQKKHQQPTVESSTKDTPQPSMTPEPKNNNGNDNKNKDKGKKK